MHGAAACVSSACTYAVRLLASRRQRACDSLAAGPCSRGGEGSACGLLEGGAVRAAPLTAGGGRQQQRRGAALPTRRSYVHTRQHRPHPARMRRAPATVWRETGGGGVRGKCSRAHTHHTHTHIYTPLCTPPYPPPPNTPSLNTRKQPRRRGRKTVCERARARERLGLGGAGRVQPRARRGAGQGGCGRVQGGGPAHV